MKSIRTVFFAAVFLAGSVLACAFVVNAEQRIVLEGTGQSVFYYEEDSLLDVSALNNFDVINILNQAYLYYPYQQIDESNRTCEYTSIGMAVSEDNNNWYSISDNPIFEGSCKDFYTQWSGTTAGGQISDQHVRNFDFPFVVATGSDNYRIFFTSYYDYFYWLQGWGGNWGQTRATKQQTWSIITSTSEDGLSWNEASPTSINFSDSCSLGMTITCVLENPPDEITLHHAEVKNNEYTLWYKRGDTNYVSTSSDGIDFEDEQVVDLGIVDYSGFKNYHPGDIAEVTLYIENNGYMEEVAVTLNIAPTTNHNDLFYDSHIEDSDITIAPFQGITSVTFEVKIPLDAEFGEYDLLAAVRDASWISGNDDAFLYDVTGGQYNSDFSHDDIWINNVFSIRDRLDCEGIISINNLNFDREYFAGLNFGNSIITSCGANIYDNSDIRLTHESFDEFEGTSIISTENLGLGTFSAEVNIPKEPGVAFSFILYKKVEGKKYQAGFDFIPNDSALYIGGYNEWRDDLNYEHNKASREFLAQIELENSFWDSWQQLKFTRTNGIVEFYINDSFIGSVEDASPSEDLYIAFSVWSPSEAIFPNAGLVKSDERVEFYVRNIFSDEKAVTCLTPSDNTAIDNFEEYIVFTWENNLSGADDHTYDVLYRESSDHSKIKSIGNMSSDTTLKFYDAEINVIGEWQVVIYDTQGNIVGHSPWFTFERKYRDNLHPDLLELLYSLDDLESAIYDRIDADRENLSTAMAYLSLIMDSDIGSAAFASFIEDAETVSESYDMTLKIIFSGSEALGSAADLFSGVLFTQAVNYVYGKQRDNQLNYMREVFNLYDNLWAQNSKSFDEIRQYISQHLENGFPDADIGFGFRNMKDDIKKQFADIRFRLGTEFDADNLPAADFVKMINVTTQSIQNSIKLETPLLYFDQNSFGWVSALSGNSRYWKDKASDLYWEEEKKRNVEWWTSTALGGAFVGKTALAIGTAKPTLGASLGAWKIAEKSLAAAKMGSNTYFAANNLEINRLAIVLAIDYLDSALAELRRFNPLFVEEGGDVDPSSAIVPATVHMISEYLEGRSIEPLDSYSMTVTAFSAPEIIFTELNGMAIADGTLSLRNTGDRAAKPSLHIYVNSWTGKTYHKIAVGHITDEIPKMEPGDEITLNWRSEVVGLGLMPSYIEIFIGMGPQLINFGIEETGAKLTIAPIDSGINQGTIVDETFFTGWIGEQIEHEPSAEAGYVTYTLYEQAYGNLSLYVYDAHGNKYHAPSDTYPQSIRLPVIPGEKYTVEVIDNSILSTQHISVLPNQKMPSVPLVGASLNEQFKVMVLEEVALDSVIRVSPAEYIFVYQDSIDEMILNFSLREISFQSPAKGLTASVSELINKRGDVISPEVIDVTLDVYELPAGGQGLLELTIPAHNLSDFPYRGQVDIQTDSGMYGAEIIITEGLRVAYRSMDHREGTTPFDLTSYNADDIVLVQNKPENLIRDEYAFVGWNTQADGSGDYYAPGSTLKMPDTNITLYAQWVLQESTGSLQVSIEPEEAFTDGAAWRREGSAIWHAGGHTESDIPAGDHTIEFVGISGWTPPEPIHINIEAGETSVALGQYERQAVDYTVTFADHDGTELDTQTVSHGSSATAPEDPNRDGYTFIGWDSMFDNVTENLTVTAQYDINQYMVIFADHDGTEIKIETVDHGSSASPPAEPTRDGYTFTGWDIRFDHVTRNLTVTAQYKKTDEDEDEIMPRLVLSGEKQEIDITSDSRIIGTGASETLNIYPNINVDFTAGDGDRVNLPDDLEHYKITSMGNHIFFSDAAANKVVTIIVTGTSTVGFAGGSTATLEMVFSPGDPPQVQLGGAIVGTTVLDHDLVELWFESDTHPDTITNSIGMTFNYIEPGTFLMGSPEDEPGHSFSERQHQVTLTQGYYMQTTEVTQGQWKAVMGSNPSWFSNCGDTCPVEMVSWNMAQDFIAALNQREGTTRYALPTEAQWEYAARAGSTTAFANGQITESGHGYDPVLDRIGWYSYNSEVTYAGCLDASGWGGSSCAGAHPVAQKEPNVWGLYDMHGNVYEWVADWYGSYSSSDVTDPTGPSLGIERVMRGGSWNDNALLCRSATRLIASPNYGGASYGFRLVLLPENESKFTSVPVRDFYDWGEYIENNGTSEVLGFVPKRIRLTATGDSSWISQYSHHDDSVGLKATIAIENIGGDLNDIGIRKPSIAHTTKGNHIYGSLAVTEIEEKYKVIYYLVERDPLSGHILDYLHSGYLGEIADPMEENFTFSIARIGHEVHFHAEGYGYEVFTLSNVDDYISSQCDLYVWSGYGVNAHSEAIFSNVEILYLAD